MISVIIPSYNSAPFIERTLRSVVSQDYTDREIIVVDDGSTDSSPAILDEIATRTAEMRVVHIPNGGAYAARLRGVAEAHGEWVTFIDSDDTLCPGALSNLAQLASDTDCDIVCGTMNLNNEAIFQHQVNGKLTGTEYAAAILDGKTTISNCAKLMRRSLFEGSLVLRRDIVHNEDLTLILYIALKAKNVFIDNTIVVYNYLWRDDSISKSHKSPLDVWLSLFSVIKDIIAPYPELKAPFTRYRLHRLLDGVMLNGIRVHSSMPPIAAILREADGITLDKEATLAISMLNSDIRRRIAWWSHATRCYLRKYYRKLRPRR